MCEFLVFFISPPQASFQVQLGRLKFEQSIIFKFNIQKLEIICGAHSCNEGNQVDLDIVFVGCVITDIVVCLGLEGQGPESGCQSVSMLRPHVLH
uniref:Uncharacterized protein n=1 Tax=Anguilla anguilla TaxID=7936 RepID=A0A0E9WMZ3_ANGAN